MPRPGLAFIADQPAESVKRRLHRRRLGQRQGGSRPSRFKRGPRGRACQQARDQPVVLGPARSAIMVQSTDDQDALTHANLEQYRAVLDRAQAGQGANENLRSRRKGLEDYLVRAFDAELAHAEAGLNRIHDLPVLQETKPRPVECRVIRRPELGLGHGGSQFDPCARRSAGEETFVLLR